MATIFTQPIANRPPCVQVDPQLVNFHANCEAVVSQAAHRHLYLAENLQLPDMIPVKKGPRRLTEVIALGLLSRVSVPQHDGHFVSRFNRKKTPWVKMLGKVIFHTIADADRENGLHIFRLEQAANNINILVPGTSERIVCRT
jgi:hypothetical protein